MKRKKNSEAGRWGKPKTKSMSKKKGSRCFSWLCCCCSRRNCAAESDSVNKTGDVQDPETNNENTRGGCQAKSLMAAANDKEKEMENTDKIENKCDPLNEASGTKHSEKNEDSTVHESEIRSLPSATCEKGGIDMDTSGNKNKLSVNITKEDRNQCDEDSKSVLRKLHMQQQKLSPPDRLQTGPPMKKDHETSETDLAHTFLYNNEIPAAKEREESEIEPLIPSMTNVKVNLEKSVPEMKCDSLNEPGGTDHTEKNDDIKKLESEFESVLSATYEKGAIDMQMDGNKNKDSGKISDEINMRNQFQRQTKSLYVRLHLQDKLDLTLSLADFLKISPAVEQDHETYEKDLAHTFLQRLMMLDYRARYIPVKQIRAEMSQSQTVPVLEISDTEDNDFDALFSSSVDSDHSKQTHVHPMDVQMAVYHCSDSFLKQNMVTKLSQCQYALPLLVPDPVTMDIECPLWTFRQIIKTWKITQTKDNSNIVTMKNMPIYKAETPMVSFFRLGSLSVSKSQLMNTLINDRHSTFFHRNCPGSTKSHHLMDGVAEIAWYCPAGKPNDNFTDCTAFCNLHGDALLIEKQRDILTEKSSVNVVLLPTLEKGDKSWAVISDLLKSPKPLICLITDNDCGAVQMKEGKYRIGLKDRSQADVSENLKRIIREILSGPHQSFQLETMADVSEIRVDEDDKVCQKGKSAALNIVNLLQGMDVSKIKDQFLPCQGELWHKWCRINKELYHLKGNIEEEKCKKEKELEKIRQDQCTASCSELMKLFNENLSSLPTTEKQYFLKWTQILIDALSTDDLSSILQYYDEKWSEVLDLKKKHDKSDLLKFKQSELEEISNKLQSATFGLEHIFREMGQIYEAHKALNQTDWSKYPELAAELMISGHPMELMDGDAGHVPLTWISSLLDEVIRKLGDQRVFVLSVLGVQSSGKSTMLNAMFGLQFAVSAGRCTKGAFMQLVKVSEEMKKDFQFDYVLVVDTEGLRALELAGNTTLHHDNELATFVVGLGNMTLINIFGENPADMQDVLQIVVQAFMRMKKVKLSPSCVFVHQNVTDIAAAEKNMDGKRRLQEKLDQMTKLAAKEEVCGAECFSDVIAFDVQKDVKYFAQLWEGSPPMAPPNPGYSESIQDLKNFILSKASQSAGMTLSHFKTKIQDLWNALMNEHFVFSFKNTLEIAVYRKLEVQYGNWTWNLRSNMLTIENQLHTRVENGDIDKVEVSFLNKEMSKTYEEIRNNLTTYFEDKREKETLVQWRGRFEQKIKEFHDELVKGAKRKLEEVLQQKKVCKKLDAQKTEFERNLLQKSKELAHQLKDKVKDEEELEKQFKSVWSHWVNELTADTKPIEDIKLEEDQFNVLKELGIEWTYVSESRSSRRYRNISSIGDYSDYVSFTKHQVHCDTSQQSQIKSLAKQYYAQLKKYMTSLQHEDQQLIRSLTENVEAQCINAIKSKPVATRGYSPTYLLEMAKSVKKEVTEFDSKWKYSLKKEFTVDLLLYVFHRADSWLSESHKKYKMNNDAVTYLESKKTQYYNIFRSFCKGSSSAVVFAELICEKLKVSIVKAACNMAAIDLAGEMRSNFPAFNGNRLNLEKHVLKSLAEKKDFDGFITYIHHPRKHVETFIKEEVNKYIFTDHKDKALNILKKNVEDMCKLVSQALFTATDKVKTNGGDIDMWLQQFSSLLKNDLTFETICSQNFSDINNFDFFKEEIEKGLKISNIPPGHEEFREKPHKILIDQLSNCCWVKCPFCSAVCTNTIKDHSPEDHSVLFHRSTSVNGVHYRNSVELCVEFCTTNVSSDRRFYPRGDSEELIPYKLYRTAGKGFEDWSITPDGSNLTYWKWFVSKFRTELENHYKLKFGDRSKILDAWALYTKEQAIQSLDEMYNM
ncbi:interferon-induced very large GTPase 1-like isoform X2 [Channa argus]|uniref:interferon-induced very large GTPase 1-like isoform X2 n=1 Tax=Channa argus TaxID=215402 RepID=UPI0035224F5E